MLEVKGLKKTFGGFILGPLSFDLEAGRHLVLLGPSGSGKSLILEMISGFRKVDDGQIFLNGEDITKLPVQQRKCGFIYQHAALFPHMSVAKNIAYPLIAIGQSRTAARKKTAELADRLSVSHLLDRQPGSLSGGEVQRASIARALAMQPQLLLLDEPLSALDVQMRADLREVLFQLKKDGLTMLHVTHDYEEAVRLADHVGIMHKGQLVQSGTTTEVFREPASGFVAHLTGMRNYFEAELDEKKPSQLREANANGVFIRLFSQSPGGKGLVLINEEHITLHAFKPESSAQNLLDGSVIAIHKLATGSEVMIDAGIILVVKVSDESVSKLQLQLGKQLFISFKASAVRFLSF